MLVVLGATVALGAERLAGGPGSAPTPRPTASVDASAGVDSIPPVASDTTDVIPSDSLADSPAPSESPVAPILDAEMPRSVNGTTLTVETDLGSSILGNDPGTRSFGAAVGTLGAKIDALEIGFAYDEAGSLPLTVLGFRIPGVSPEKLRPLILDAWLSAKAPGVKTSSVDLNGVPTTRVDYGDEGAYEYVFVRGDTVFVIETSDQSLATATMKAMPAASTSGGSGAPASPSASG